VWFGGQGLPSTQIHVGFTAVSQLSHAVCVSRLSRAYILWLSRAVSRLSRAVSRCLAAVSRLCLFDTCTCLAAVLHCFAAVRRGGACSISDLPKSPKSPPSIPGLSIMEHGCARRRLAACAGRMSVIERLNSEISIVLWSQESHQRQSYLRKFTGHISIFRGRDWTKEQGPSFRASGSERPPKPSAGRSSDQLSTMVLMVRELQ
jgi:hypothetical protein